MKKILILQNEIMEYRKPVYNGLAESYDVTVLHSGPPSVKEEDRYREVIVPYRRLWRFRLQPRSPLNGMICEFDAVIAGYNLAWPGYLAPLFWRKRPKYILWGHRYSKYRVARAISDQLMHKADRLLMYGDEEVERMIDRGVDPTKIAVAWNTVHVPNHHDYSDVPKNSLLFVGRLQPMKRVDLVIGAFARLQSRIPDGTVLDIVGSAANNPASGHVATNIETDLRQLATDLDVSDKVFFHGTVDFPEDLAKAFSRAYAYVSPGHVGLGALHAFAHGVPVLTNREQNRTPEYYNLRDGQNTLFFEDLAELEGAIEKLCTDPVFATELGRNAYRHYAQERTLDKMLEGFHKAIEE